LHRGGNAFPTAYNPIKLHQPSLLPTLPTRGLGSMQGKEVLHQPKLLLKVDPLPRFRGCQNGLPYLLKA
jgi:hypothetical protein